MRPESICVAIDSKNLKKLASAVPKKDVIGSYDNLSEIAVNLSGEALTTPGVLAVLATEFAINGVNLIMSTAPPFSHIFLLDETQALDGYRVMESLRKGS